MSVCWPESAAWSGGTHRRRKALVHGPYPATDPFLAVKATPSQRATIKYFFVVVILWGVQILMGILTAHYAVEGHGFYGFPLDRYLPYAVTRTWHLQLAIFWIATSWLATGLYVGPAVTGHEPKYPATRRQCALWRIDSCGRRLTCRRVVGHPAASWQHVVLVRKPGL